MVWTAGLAKSLITMLEQFDALAPSRDTDSDGTIGDTAHSTRKSDHNLDAQGRVKALDITHDPEHGVDTWKIADQLLASHDPRISYIISNGRIGGDEDYAQRNGIRPWTWTRYTGSNPHKHHMHVSVDKDGPGFDDRSAWDFQLTPVVETEVKVPVNPTLRRGSKGASVKHLQALLGISVDGIFGANTEKAVRLFQAKNTLTDDGVVGRYTWEQLLKDKVDAPKFYSQVDGGYFSSTPLDLSIHTSIRTNNPGALNVADWVKQLPGYISDKVTSWSGSSPNSTVIFQTPEDGIVAWYKLMERYAKRGANTISRIIIEYGGHGQDYRAYVNYVANRLDVPKETRIVLTGDDQQLLKFAKAMFRYEAGEETPLSDNQILFGFKLARGEVNRRDK